MVNLSVKEKPLGEKLERICRLCGRKTNNNNGARCRACDARIRRYRVRSAAIALLGGKCEACGNNDARVLEFHHIEDNKEFGISSATDGSWVRVKAEVLKCRLLCANDHRVLHTYVSDSRFLEEAASYSGKII